MKSTIFQRYGGFASVSKVVMSFYDKVLDSPVASPYFANTNMKRLIDHQTKFIAQIMGGPVSYTDEQLERCACAPRHYRGCFHGNDGTTNGNFGGFRFC